MRFPKPQKEPTVIRKLKKLMRTAYLQRNTPLRRSSKPIARRKRPRPVRAGTAAALEREAWSLMSRIVRAERPICERCRQRASTDTAHVFRRAAESTKLLIRNLFSLCRACHEYLGSASLAGKPSRMEDFFIAEHGREEFELLRQRAQRTRKFDPRVLDALRSRAAKLGLAVPAIPGKEIPY